ncbi:MAG: hypothetical protein ABQ298_03980 [Puniceicoccaceae bacterium]
MPTPIIAVVMSDRISKSLLNCRTRSLPAFKIATMSSGSMKVVSAGKSLNAKSPVSGNDSPPPPKPIKETLPTLGRTPASPGDGKLSNSAPIASN